MNVARGRIPTDAQHSWDIVLFLDADMAVRYACNSAGRILGHEASRLAGKNVLEYVHPEDVPGVKAGLAHTVQRAGIGAPMEFRVRHADGSWVSLESVTNNLLWDAGARRVVLLARNVTARKRAEDRMRTREAALESSINGIAFADLESNLTYVNRSFREMWGYEDVDDILGRPAFEFWENREKASEAVKALKGRGGWIGELTAKRKDGSLFDVQVCSTMVKDETGGPICMMGSFVDISQRKRAEEALRKSEELWRSVIEQAHDGIVVTDGQGNVIEWNKAQEQISGLKRDDVLGRPLWDVQFHMLVGEMRTQEMYEQIRAGTLQVVEKEGTAWQGEVREIELQRPDGARRSVQAVSFALPIETDSGTMTATIIRDITERRRAEEEVRYRAQILDRLEVGINLVRPNDGTLQDVNPRFEAMFRYEPGELAGKHVSVLNAPGEKDAAETAAEIMQCLNDSGRWSGDIKNIRKDGSILWCHARVVEVDHPEHGRTWASVHDDITDRKRAESEREELIQELQEAVSKIKTLRGLLPICASCKKIRDDKGYWKQVEVYVRDHSEAQFTHSLCPDCLKKLYPELSGDTE